ncbi:hypothetical protein A1Q2_07719 [Trichosporon asahii var. asahii CBS 8904]|uniref:CUE domain-containing protein n=1 Tax=Trichosporon asahii var. asahii (strain CBS 8904) TaxID=1220162 RepID=K1VMH6_TRIAC|nr:hypothetical protein A1Q2_07719 [Trichosporon asahii var. asahii CBS 8904]
MTIPTGSPPSELLPKALSYQAMEVGKAAPLGPSGVLAPLSAFLGLLARHRTSAPLGPLHAFSTLCDESPESISLPLACDALLAYPAAVSVLDPALSHLKLDWDGLLSALPSRVSAPGGVRAVRLAHSLLRLRSTENAVVKHSEALMRALAKAYGGADTRSKGEMLVLARALVGKDHELRRLLENEGPRGVPLVNQSMGRDYADLFEAHRALGDAEAAATRGAHDEEHGADPRLANLTALFPHIPAHLLSDALAHPNFTAAGANTDDAAAPLIDAILGNELPAELSALKAAASADGPAAAASPVAPTVEPVPEPAPAPPRRSQFTDADLAKLRIKDTETVPDLDLGREIPNQLRDSILRLVQAQEEEAEEAARAIAEARGYASDEEEYQRVIATRDGGETTDRDEEEVDLASERSSSPPPGLERPSKSHAQTQTKLELAYLRTPEVFARDSATRRSKARQQLREDTGMDDGQIEGWKIMLERNPNKGSRGHSNAARVSGRDKKMSKMGAGL